VSGIEESNDRFGKTQDSAQVKYPALKGEASCPIFGEGLVCAKIEYMFPAPVMNCHSILSFLLTF
jgi:hypothetical protein